MKALAGSALRAGQHAGIVVYEGGGVYRGRNGYELTTAVRFGHWIGHSSKPQPLDLLTGATLHLSIVLNHKSMVHI